MTITMYFKPVTIDLATVDDPVEAYNFVVHATQETLQDYLNENWSNLVDPSQPLIERVEVKP